MTETALSVAQNKDNSNHPYVFGLTPTATWDMDKLAEYADHQHSMIHTADTSVTPYYWRLGAALAVVRKTIKRQFPEFLKEHGIHKVRASKAQAIARHYGSSDELIGISIHDAYQAIPKKPRKQKASQPENPQEEGGETDLPKTTPADSDDAAPVTTALVSLNAGLEALAKDVAIKGIGTDETYAQVVSHIDKVIETLRAMKTKILE